MNRRSTGATTMSCRYLAMLSRRITSVAPDMDLLNDKECFARPEMLHKADQNKHGGHSSILARWHNDYENRNSLSLVGWTEQDDTLSAVCIEKVVCIKTQDELFQKVHITPRVPRVVRNSNSQIGLPDQHEQDARTSYDQPRGSKCSWETGSNTVDHRIPGIEQQDTHRKDKVKRLIEKFDNHPNKESFFQDFKQTRRRSTSSARSRRS